jgi:ketosteroid isomerase-like protein
VKIEGSRHEPVGAHLVPELIEEMCDYVNEHWQASTPLHLAAYIMWRLNWIHPFADGNGRTSRILSYVVLSIRAGAVPPGTPTIPDQHLTSMYGRSAMSPEANLQTAHKYFDACNTGDLDALMSTLDADVVHYFLPDIHKPIRGGEQLARYWRTFHLVCKAVWRIDHALSNGEEVVVEWSCAYLPRGKQVRMMFRGTEWHLLKSGRIAEIRAYYQYEESRDCELTGFPYKQRGYLSKDAQEPVKRGRANTPAPFA